MATDQQLLDRWCYEAKKLLWVAIDTEFHRADHYYPEISLIQLANQNGSIVIDCFAGLKLHALHQLLRDTNIVKVFHSARQDLEALYRLCGIIPEPIFDTQIAACCLGYTHTVGLAMLAKKLLGIEIDKAAQNANWLMRPLPDHLLEYAKQDVEITSRIFQCMQSLLNKVQKWIVYAESTIKLTEIHTSIEDLLVRLGLNKHDDINLALSILQHREQIAKTNNSSRQTVLTDAQIIQHLREEMPLPHFFQQHFKMKQFNYAQHHSEYHLADAKELQILYNLRKYIAEELGVAEFLLANNKELRKMLQHNYKSAYNDWRYYCFVKYVNEIKQGKAYMKKIAQNKWQLYRRVYWFFNMKVKVVNELVREINI